MSNRTVFYHPDSPCIGCQFERKNGECRHANVSALGGVSACLEWKEWFKGHWRLTTKNIQEALNGR